MPHHAVTQLVTTGPFRLTRNPMYTGHVIVLLGAALRTGSWWPLLVAPLCIGPRQGWSFFPKRTTSPTDSGRTTSATAHEFGAGSRDPDRRGGPPARAESAY